MDILRPNLPSPLQELVNADTRAAGIRLWIKRDDLIHPTVSGNKWRKLKYNLLEAQSQGFKSILTFGGAYSNHLYATAAAGYALDLHTVGIVRGDELADADNPTLTFCKDHGMDLHFVSRTEYRQRSDDAYLQELSGRFGHPFLIPEGGTTALALKGEAEMVSEIEDQLGGLPDYISTPAGTGGTAAGILSAGCQVMAFAALKNGLFLGNDIQTLVADYENRGSLVLLTDYHFGGYAKWKPELLAFMDQFKAEFDIQLEQVYTGKMFYGLFDLIKMGHFDRGASIVAVHTGGLQGLLRT